MSFVERGEQLKLMHLDSRFHTNTIDIDFMFSCIDLQTQIGISFFWAGLNHRSNFLLLLRIFLEFEQYHPVGKGYLVVVL